ncbi:plastocyanin/azurin family copper-binding protein [Salisaeta longa]|uniref:plastocyanin/azurin family copper-binding protein n=1 Tax=Salisaeta longa TaxID=503170 RepID=UPI0003B32991|nr:plastocyanin/azurin family copper-binding protein [Salisaeta longa]
MQTFFSLRRLSLLALSVLFLTACGGSSGDASSASAEQQATASTSQATPAGVDKLVTIEPKGNQMKYKQTEFTVAPGAKVKLVFDNTATSPSMQHNVVVLTKGPTDEHFQEVGTTGMQAGMSNDYVPDLPLVLAATPIAKPGETVSVTFTAPSETGDYGYVCTFPGHWATMQGVMHVRS